MAVTLRQLAQQLGLSAATLSMVLNNKPGISQQTRDRVMAAIHESGYVYKRPSAPIKPQNSSLTFAIYKKHGQLVSNTPFFSVLIEAIQRAAAVEGFALNLIYVNQGELERVPNGRSEGVLLLGTEMNQDDLTPLLHRAQPLVVLDNSFFGSPVNTVCIDNMGGMSQAVDLLVSQGHRHIGYLRSSVDIRNFRERRAGYYDAMRRSGLSLNESDVIALPPTIDGAHQALREYMAASPLLASAYVADMDFIALGAMQAMSDLGLHVGSDIALIGFDDIFLTATTVPALTTVHVYTDVLGATAVRRLSELIAQPDQQPTHIAVGTSLTLRSSVQPHV